MLSPSSPLPAPHSAGSSVVYKNEDNSVRGVLFGLIEEIWKEKDSKNLFGFICVLATFLAVEMVYGFQSNSLGLLSDAFNVSFHCLALLTSLIAMILARKPPSFEFSYGYDRCEVVAAFTAANCLIFVCLFLVVHSMHRMYEPVELAGSRTLEFGAVGLAINLCGVLMFGKRASRFTPFSRVSSSESAVIGAHQSNVQAVYLHVFSDVLSSLSVICSALLLRWQGWLVVDALQSLLVACLTLYSVVPLFKATGLMLVQVRPQHLKAALDRCKREVSAVEGVLEIVEVHYWTQAPSVIVGSVHLRVRSNADEQNILATVHRVFSRHIAHLTIQIEKDDWLLPGEASVPTLRS